MPSPKIPCDCSVCGTEFLCDATNYRRAKNGERYCSRKCYYLRHGSTLEERFWHKVKKSDGCWEWQGYRDEDGYGSIGSFGNADRVSAHRFSWQLHKGPIPDGLLVLHKCDNPSCVRPDHLFLGTNRENINDMLRKGRSTRGKNSIAAKLSDEQVKDIRHRYDLGQASVAALAHEFSVRRITISRIVRGIHYRHLL